MTATVPEARDVAVAQSTVITDRAGRPIARLHAEVDRVDVPLSEMPKSLRDAVIAAEDHDFYSHGGVSFTSIVRAAFVNVVRREAAQGGSTITQQYVKNAYVGSRRTIWRKVREAMVAIKLERGASKDEILERYLNTVYFGRGAYGAQAAAQVYFAKNAGNLDVAQSAYLAGLIRSPGTYVRNPDKAKARRDRVIDQMVALEMLAADRAAALKKTPVKIAPKRSTFDALAAPFFVEDVRRELLSRFGEDEVFRGGLRVTTTLDLNLQRIAEKSVARVLDRPSDPNTALVSVDPATGAIRALVGGRDFSKSQVNVATNSRGRQPGSAFKPFVLAASIEDGISVRSRFRAPAEITIDTGLDPWKVGNYDHRDYGQLDLVQATANSVNTVYAQLISKVGPDRVVEAAHRAGINSKLDPVLSLTLGTENVNVTEMAGAYATFATGGLYRQPYMIERVRERDGTTLFAAKPRSQNALPADVAYTVSYAMQQVMEQGTGRRVDLDRPAAGKTGTTENHVDAWFGGFTPDLVSVVWMGFNEGGRTMENVRGIAVTGGSFPGQIWHDFMTEALAKVPPRGFPEPDFSGQTIGASPSPSPSPTPSKTVIPSATVVPAPTQSPKAKPTKSPTPTPSASASAGTAQPYRGGG